MYFKLREKCSIKILYKPVGDVDDGTSSDNACAFALSLTVSLFRKFSKSVKISETVINRCSSLYGC